MPERIDFNDLPYHPELDEERPVAPPQRIDFNELTMGQKFSRDIGMMGTMLESTGRGFVDNMLNLPNAIGDVVGYGLAYPTAAVQSLTTNLAERGARFNMATGEPLTPYGGWEANLEAAKNTWPASTLIRGHDAPTSTDIQALAGPAAMAAYQYRTPEEYAPMAEERRPREITDLGEMYRQERDDILEGYLQRREAQPIGAGTGDVLADVATVVSGRAPIVSAGRKVRLSQPPAKPVVIEPGLRRWMQRKWDDIGSWARTSGLRIAETGVEGAILAALQDEDPISGAAFGAGMQAVGNATDTVWKHFPGKTPSMKLAYGALATTALIQVFKSLTPGGRDRILESEESAFNKMAAVVALGALSKAAGFGRPSRTIQDDLGAIIDTWHSARRGAVISLWSEMQNDDSGDIDRVMTKIFEDLTYFDTTAMRRISHASMNEDVSMGDTIESLMEADRKFRRKLLALREQQ